MGLLKKLADKQNWSDKKRRKIDLILEVIWWSGWIFFMIKASECSCVEGVPIHEFNDCYIDCMADMNNPSFCQRKCAYIMPNNYTEINISDLNFSNINKSIISQPLH